MSTCTVKEGKHLSPAARMAVVAAVAAGRSQSQVARDFGIHRNSVHALCKTVRDEVKHPLNVLAHDYKAGLRYKAVQAVEQGLDSKRDAYKRAHIGIRVLEGIGEFVTGSQVKVEGSVDLVVSWAPQQAVIENSEPIDTDARLLSD